MTELERLAKWIEGNDDYISCEDRYCTGCPWENSLTCITDVRDAIEDLVHESMNKSNWTSLAEQPPEEHTDVFMTGIETLNNKRVYAVRVYDNGVFRPEYAPSIQWDYWMKPPQLPKQKPLTGAEQ